MDLLMEDTDDLLGLGSTNHLDTLDKTLKSLQSITNRQQQRLEREQQQGKQREAQELELAALESGEGGGTTQRLAQQQQCIDALGASVQDNLQKDDDSDGGPEPAVYAALIERVQPLPVLQLQELPGLLDALQQRQFLGLDPPAAAAGTSNSSDSWTQQQLADVFFDLLSRGAAGPLGQHCPDEAAARLVFAAVCYGDRRTAATAYRRFMAWCGEPEVLAGSQALPLHLLHKWVGPALPTSRPHGSAQAETPDTQLSDIIMGATSSSSSSGSSIKWLPSAADVLQALAALGVKHQPQPQQLRASQRTSQASQQQSQEQQEQQEDELGQQALAFRHGNLPLLLQLLGRVARGHAAGRVDASGLVANQQNLQQLLLSLLGLMLDTRVTATCRYLLPEAFAALLELPDARLWDRLATDTKPGSLLHGLSGGLGPSHRSSLVLLGQLPGSRRGRVLRQLGALQLLSKLIPGAKKQVPPARLSAMIESSPQESQSLLHKELQGLLGPPGKVRALLGSLSQPPGPGSKLQVWLLLSVMEAAHHVLWANASTDTGIGRAMQSWFLDWLEDLDRAVEKKLSSHRVRSLVAALQNTYTFAQNGCVVAREDA